MEMVNKKFAIPLICSLAVKGLSENLAAVTPAPAFCGQR